MYQLPPDRQTITPEILEFLEVMLPNSGNNLIKQGIAHQSLSGLTVYLAELVLQANGKYQKLDRGPSWFLPDKHPYIYAVRHQIEEPFHAWQVREHYGSDVYTVTFSRSPKREHLQVTLNVKDPNADETSTQILGLEVKTVDTASEQYTLVYDLRIFKVKDSNPENRLYLVEKRHEIDISSRASFWLYDKSDPLFGPKNSQKTNSSQS